jgi:hypothetical protein
VRPWKPILAALVIFAAGVVTGRLLLPTHPPAVSERQDNDGRDGRRGGPPRGGPWNPQLSEEDIQDICGRMTRDLSLSPTQSNEIRGIITDSQSRMKAIAEEFGPRARDEFRRTRDQIKAVLTPEQLATFEEAFKKRQGRRDRSPDDDDRHGERRRGFDDGDRRLDEQPPSPAPE